MSEIVKIFLVSQEPLVQVVVRVTLAEVKDFDLVGIIGESDQILVQCQEHKPDILLLDLSSFEGNLTEVRATLVRNRLETKIIVLTAVCNSSCFEMLVKARVVNYILHRDMPQSLLPAIRAATSGLAVLSPPLLEEIIEEEEMAQITPEASGLTHRERMLLPMLAAGKTNGEIASELGISEKTVEKYLGTVYKKLGVRSRVETAVWAVKNGLA